MRGTADGHIVLSRELAERGQYPAIDVLGSLSRVMGQVIEPDHKEDAARFRELLASARAAEDLRSLGAYEPGASARHDQALQIAPALREFIAQRPDERAGLEQTRAQLTELLEADASPANEFAGRGGSRANVRAPGGAYRQGRA